MDILLFIVMAVLLAYIVFSNIKLIKRYKHNKKYIESYQSIFHNKDNCFQTLETYMNSEDNSEFLNKAKIIKLYYQIDNDLDYKDTLDSLNLREIYYTNGKLNPELVKLNSDSFIFMVLLIGKAHEKGNRESVDSLINKLNECSDMNNYLEYKIVISFADILYSNNANGKDFMHSLLDGEYSEYQYDKKMIGLYKRIASCALVYIHEEIDEYFKNDLSIFAKAFIGECLLKSIGLFEKYAPTNEDAEVKEDENQE